MGKVREDELEEFNEALNYLANFWEHKVDSTIKLPDGSKTIITGVDETHPEQITVKNSEMIHYAQDISWEPEPWELEDLLKKFQIEICSDCIRLGNNFLAKPTTWPQYAQAIRSYRLIKLSSGRDIVAEFMERQAKLLLPH